MGFFSWKTADTDESVWNCYAADMGAPACRPVFLLQPNGAAPVEEPVYEGYGQFGGIDVYDWLARANLPAAMLAGLDADAVRGLGVTLDCGGYYVDSETGKKWSVFHEGLEVLVPDITSFRGSYEANIPELGMKPNDLIASGRFVEHSFTDMITTPIKLSFDANARYEDLPASVRCEHQGFFYVDDEEEQEQEEEEDTVY